MVPSLVISVDPSYHGFGISILKNGELFLTEIKTKHKIKTFKDCVLGGTDVLGRFKLLLDKYTAEKDSLLLIEVPPTGGIYSPGLFLLDGSLVMLTLKAGFKCFGVSCKTCKSVLGSQKATKDDSVMFANDYLRHKKIPFSFLDKNNEGIESDNIAESLIMLIAFSYRLGWGSEVFPGFDTFSKKNLSELNLVDFNVD